MADFTADQLAEYARTGVAMPDESYPIPDSEHLDKAIEAVGRGTNNTHAAIRRHIMNRAAKLGLAARIPDTWNADGTLKIEKVDLRTPLWKDDAKRIVYGVVMSPGLRDSQGDISDAADIEKAAHRFLTDYRKHDVQHAEVTTTFDGVPIAETVESFIAPQTMDIAGERVVKGAWVLATHITDDDAWNRVQKGEITGYSIGGSGVRIPETA